MAEVLARHAAPVAIEMLAHFPGLVIEGARQVGESTLATTIADPDAVVVTLDDERVCPMNNEDVPDGFDRV